MKEKTFDCVRMKHEIQARLRQEYAGLTWAERNRRIRAALAADPHLEKLLRASAGAGAATDASRSAQAG